MNNPRRHHFIPKCYLKPFTDSSRRIWQKFTGQPEIHQKTSGQIGYEIDSNKIRTKHLFFFEGVPDEYYIEKEAFKAQENNYGKIIRNIVKYSTGPLLIDKIKYKLFLESLITIKRRNPSSRIDIVNSFRNGFNPNQYISEYRVYMKEQFGIEDISAEQEEYIRKYIENEAKSEDRLHDLYLSAYIKPNEYHTITQLTSDLYDLKQYILHAPIGTQFITSDNPGFTTVKNRLLSIGGFGDSFLFFFPLSPSACLFLKLTQKEEKDNLEKLIHPIIISQKKVSAINRLTKHISVNYILGSNKAILESM